MTKKLYLETVGCQMNVLDSELVVGSLRRQGYELVHEPTAADLGRSYVHCWAGRMRAEHAGWASIE